jgi:hypothetical protein
MRVRRMSLSCCCDLDRHGDECEGSSKARAEETNKQLPKLWVRSMRWLWLAFFSLQRSQSCVVAWLFSAAFFSTRQCARVMCFVFVVRFSIDDSSRWNRKHHFDQECMVPVFNCLE